MPKKTFLLYRAPEYQILSIAAQEVNLSKLSLSYLEKKSGLSTSTLRRIKKWHIEPTQYRPQLKTIEFTLRALGKKLSVKDL